jgi:hypothetical protein
LRNNLEKTRVLPIDKTELTVYAAITGVSKGLLLPFLLSEGKKFS